MAMKSRIKVAIKVMERIKEQKRKFDMSDYQRNNSNNSNNIVYNIKDADRETACCFAGWLALSPEFRRAGGSVTLDGVPRFNYCNGSRSIAKYLKINIVEACKLCAVYYDMDNHWRDYYGVNSKTDITIDMVIEKLKTFL